jgi:diadenylate cyclase
MDLSKELGTRHRAGVGISEVTDSLTIIVSEETGHVSVAYEGQLYRNLDSEDLKGKLLMIQNKPIEEKKRRLWKGRSKNEKEIDG